MLGSSRIRPFWPGLVMAGVIFASWAPISSQPALAQTPARAVNVGEVSQQMRSMREEVRQLRERVEVLIRLLQKESAAEAYSKTKAAPTPLENDEPEAFTDTWNLSLRDAIHLAVQNSKVIRNLGGVTPFGVRGDETLKLARINTDVSIKTFETSLSNLVRDIETAYWDTWQAYQSLDTVISLRDDAQQQWQRIHARAEKVNAHDEAQAREQYFFARTQIEQALTKLFDDETRLRFLLGLAATDGRLIRPADEPELNHNDVERAGNVDIQTTIRSLPEVLNQKQKIKAVETQTGPLESRSNRAFQSLRLARERARLEDLLLNASHQLSSVVRNVDFTYQNAQDHRSRWKAAQEEVEKLTALLESGLTEIDLVLDASRRTAQAGHDYHLARADFAKARCDLLSRQSRLLEQHGLEIE